MTPEEISLQLDLQLDNINEQLENLRKADEANRITLISFATAMNSISVVLDSILGALKDHNIEVVLPVSVKPNKTLTS